MDRGNQRGNQRSDKDVRGTRVNLNPNGTTARTPLLPLWVPQSPHSFLHSKSALGDFRHVKSVFLVFKDFEDFSLEGTDVKHSTAVPQKATKLEPSGD